nr:Gfo/Idh/MocA family oxidoreductase [Haliscomenobacter sp.]
MSSLAGAGLVLPTTEIIGAPMLRKGPLVDKVRLGFIGTGMRGRNHVELALLRKDCEVVAICDIDPKAIAASQKMITGAGLKAAAAYGEKGERDFLRMLDKEKLDAVIIATPWEWHTEQSIACMKRGIYVGSEACGGFSLDECWELVNAHEETGAHLFFLENVCYRRDVMAVMNMVRQQMFGEILHLEGGISTICGSEIQRWGKSLRWWCGVWRKGLPVKRIGARPIPCTAMATSILPTALGQWP